MSPYDYARGYLELGWSIFPISPMNPLHKDKKPCVKWKKLQTTKPTECQLEEWWGKRFKKAGIGMATGKLSDIIAIDYDGTDAIQRFISKFGDRPNTLSFRSREGHEQDLFHYPKGYEIRNSAKEKGGLGIDGIDIRGEGGFTVIPPTVHWSGTQYQWLGIDPLEMGLYDLLELPEEILRVLIGNTDKKISRFIINKQQSKSRSNLPQWMDEIIGGVSEGARNDAATRLAGHYLREYAGDKNKTKLFLDGWNLRNRPPLSSEEIDQVIRSIALRQNKDELKQHCGLDIEEVIFRKAPRGDGSFFEFAIAGYTDRIQMSSADILTANKFRARFSDITGFLLPAMSNKEYFPLMQRLTDNARHIPMLIEETKDGYVHDIISDCIRDPMSNISEVKNALVVNEGILYLKIKVIKSIMGRDNNFLTRHEIAEILRNIGFVTNRIHDENKSRHRVWSISVEKFNSFADKQDDLSEINEIFSE
jgi:hypothetical protein